MPWVLTMTMCCSRNYPSSSHWRDRNFLGLGGFVMPKKNLLDSQIKCFMQLPCAFLLLEAKRTSLLLFVKNSVLSCFNYERFGSSVWGSWCKTMLPLPPDPSSKVWFDLVPFDLRFDLMSHTWRMWCNVCLFSSAALSSKYDDWRLSISQWKDAHLKLEIKHKTQQGMYLTFIYKSAIRDLTHVRRRRRGRHLGITLEFRIY